MEKKNGSRRNKTISIIEIAFLSCLILFSSHLKALGADPQEQQWLSVGGEQIFTVTHEFETNWSSGGNNMYWKNDEKSSGVPPSHPYDDEVSKDVLALKGSITLRGPGYLGRVTKTKGNTGFRLEGQKGEKQVIAFGLGDQEMYVVDGEYTGKWETIRGMSDVDPSKFGYASFVPDGETVTLDIYAESHWCQNCVWTKNNRGAGYPNNRAITLDLWYFPLEGGKVIQSALTEGNAEKPLPRQGREVGRVSKGEVFDKTTNKILRPGDPVHQNHDLLTDTNNEAEFILRFDGDRADTTIIMRRNSHIIIKEKIPVQKRNTVFLFLGRLFSHFRAKNSSNGYTVETFNSALAVEGTKFETAYDPNTGKTTLSVFEGAVQFNCKHGDAPPTIVNEGMFASSDNGCALNVGPLSSVDTIADSDDRTATEQDPFPGAGQESAGRIKILSATYGGNCGTATGNVTAHIARHCDGEFQCRYVVSYGTIGDPAPGCAKTYSVRYRCGDTSQEFEKSLAAEAGMGNQAVFLECSDSTGAPAAVLTGSWIVNQSNGFQGKLELQQDQSGHLTGTAGWNGNLFGSLIGKVSGNAVEFTISYPGGIKGIYKGTLTPDGIRIINGTVQGSTGETATWDASR